MNQFIVKQFFETESSTFTYFIIHWASKETIIIDPVSETFDRDFSLIKELGLKVIYILDTHVHADHITASGKLRKLTKAKTILGERAGVNCADRLIKDKEKIYLQDLEIEALTTPGHTNACTSYYVPKLNLVFTGDTLLIRGTGRTDFQQGNAAILYESITNKLFKLPDLTLVFPGHDYLGRTSTTIIEEKLFNSRIGNNRTKEEFIEIMNNLNLPNPKKINEALPANLKCGGET